MRPKEQGVLNAVKKSWRLTEEYMWELFAMLLINSVLLIIITPTLVGLIPAIGFVNTARAASYQMLKETTPPEIPKG